MKKTKDPKKTEKKVTQARKGGRPYKAIDWELVDEMLEAGCPGTEIAGTFGMHPDTFYMRVKDEKNMGFSDYYSLKTAQGAGMIRLHQFRKALGKTEIGDNTLLIFLGKTRLQQKEEQNVTVSAEVTTNFDKIMNYFDTKQQLAQKAELEWD